MIFTRSAVFLCLALAGLGSLIALAYVTAAEPTTWTAPPAAVATPAQSNAYAAQANLAAASAAAVSTRPPAATKGFKTALNNAASQAFKEGTINRWQLARIRMAIAWRADAIAEAQACVIDQACQDGVMRSPGDADLDGFDWTQLLAFIKEFLPLILQIISIFS